MKWNLKAIQDGLSSPGAFLRRGQHVTVWNNLENCGRDNANIFALPFFLSQSSAKFSDSSSCTFSMRGHSTEFELPTADDIAGFPTTCVFTPPDSELFQNTFRSIKSLISRGTLLKAVPFFYSDQRGSPTPSQLACQIARLLALAPENLNVFGFWHRHSGIIGASPEVLFEKNGAIVNTMALAGTKPRQHGFDTAIKESFLRDPKELNEHQFVIRDLQKEMQDLGEVHIGKTRILELTKLFHLQTPLTLNLKADIPGHMLAERLHPTAALGVFPRTTDYNFLEDFEPQGLRKYFGAPVVFSLPEATNPKKELGLVAIRSMQWDLARCWIGAGFGLVAGSEDDLEWQELNNKLNSILDLVGGEMFCKTVELNTDPKLNSPSPSAESSFFHE